MRACHSRKEFHLTLARLALPLACFAALFASSIAAQEGAGEPPARPLTVEAIFAKGGLVAQPPESMAWSPDGKHFTYIDGGELIDLDPGSGKPHVMVSREKLASILSSNLTETDRDHRERYGMAPYFWAPDSAHLLFDSEGRLWAFDLHNGTGVQIAFTGMASGDDPKFSPNGEEISFIRDHGLAVVRMREEGNPMNMVAPAPNSSTLNGEVDWVYEEELDTRSNYFWSPDSKNIAFLQTIETDVPQYPIEDWLPVHARVDMQRYPQPGDNNPDVRIGVVSANGGRTNWIHLPIQSGQDYIPRFGWVDRKTLWIETLTRDQKHRDLYFADLPTGRVHPVLEIKDDKFFDDNYHVTVEYGWIVLTDWSDGHNHIYLYSYDQRHLDSATAKLERQLTSGGFDVAAIVSVDVALKLVDYTSNEGNVQDLQFWQVGFDGRRKPLTIAPGHHDPNLSPTGGAFVDLYSTRMNPPAASLCKVGRDCSVFWQTRALEPYYLRAPDQLEVKADDGTPLDATLLLPDSTAPASVPLIVNPYGGPGAQTVANQWSDGLLFDELLAQHGFAVLHADNRGMGMRGRDFAQCAWHNFGPIQLEDQLAVIDSVLSKYPQLDKNRLGWWGWSWGGAFTLYAMTHSDRFRAGVSVAPVTDWRDYDSIYTERYLSQPSEFPEGYKNFSAVNSAASLKGHLLLVHGTGDDNVHIENSVQFIQRLIEADIPYDFQIYPRKTHSISGEDVRTHLYKRILAHFEQYLMPPSPAGATP
jgi:dipeptidyl-peptidase 4